MTDKRWPSPWWLLWWLGAAFSGLWAAGFAFVQFTLRTCSTDDECFGAIMLLILVGNAGFAVVPLALVIIIIGLWWIARRIIDRRRRERAS